MKYKTSFIIIGILVLLLMYLSIFCKPNINFSTKINTISTQDYQNILNSNQIIVEENKDIDKFQESVVLGLTAKQLIASILSVLVGGIIVFHTYKKVGLTLSAYIAIPVVAPIALSGFYTYNGMSFMQVMKKRIQFMFKAKPLLYKSTENAEELKKIAAQIEEEKRKTETDNKSEFNKTKKKMIVVLAVSIVSVIAAIGIACGCKFL